MCRGPYIVLALLAIAAAPAGAQEPLPPLVTDRPDVTESAVTVPPGHVQLEAGWTLESADDVDAHGVGEILVRVGVHPRVEARVGVPTWVHVDGPAGDASGLDDAALGVKLALAGTATAPPPAGWPAVALLLGTGLPTGDDEIADDAWQPEAILAVAWDLDDRTSLGMNAGAGRVAGDGEDYAQGRWSVALGRGLTERLGVYAEGFGEAPAVEDGDGAAFVDGGATFLVAPLLQIDLRVGAGVAGEADGWFVGAGIARRW